MSAQGCLVFPLVDQTNGDEIEFLVFTNSGWSELTGTANSELDYVLIHPKHSQGLPIGPNGEWEDCDECESDRVSARPIYRKLLAEGYQPA